MLGILAQWLAWRLHLPSILLLLIFGFVAGPVTGILDPDLVFGDVLFPLVSVSVAVILFEGGLSLKLSELRQVGSVVTSLTTVGILVTWVVASLLAHFVAGLDVELAVLLGAIMVVTGPTVIIPLLRQVRPRGTVGSIIKWEGIVNDPIGAILAVLVFEVIMAGGMEYGSAYVLLGAAKALALGSIIGLVGAGVVILLLKHYLVPDFLQNPIALMLVVSCYAVSDMVQPESGLMAVTVMGFALANQPWVSIKHILDFKENLRVLLISSLFIILAARLPVADVAPGNPFNWVFVLLLIVLVRPLAVLVSTARSALSLNEKLFVTWMAPRGIVAAAVASVFALRLADADYPEAEALIPLTFQVIIGTVAVYGLSAPWVARRLNVAQPDPQGVLIVGAPVWVREMAAVLQSEGFRVALVDSNWDNVTEARRAGLKAYYGNVLSEEMLYDLQLDGIGRLLAITPNDEVNSLAILHFLDLFGRSGVYQVAPLTDRRRSQSQMPKHLQGRYLFDSSATYAYLRARFQSGAKIKRTPITKEFSYEDFRQRYGSTAMPLFLIRESGKLQILSSDEAPTPRPGQVVVSVVDDVDDTAG